jgi:polyhydroxyalkanoate synthase
VTMDDRDIDLADLAVPLLAFGGASDGIAPLASVEPIADLVPQVPDFRFEIVPGGHLGMLTGRAARATTWTAIDAWVDEWSGGPVATKAPAKKPAKKPAQKAAAKRPASTKASPASIGSNPARRYGSASSRSLGGR